MLKWIEQYKKKEGIYIKKEGNTSALVLISGGEKPTSGYTIGLKKVSNKEDKIKIEYEVISPDKNAMVTQVITYPYMLIKIDDITGKEILNE